MGLPKPLLVVAVTLVVASVLGALAALVVFFRYDTEFWFYFEVGPVLKVAALILGGFSVSSGLLFVHFRSQESYLTFEAFFFLVWLAIALVKLVWMVPVLFFL